MAERACAVGSDFMLTHLRKYRDGFDYDATNHSELLRIRSASRSVLESRIIPKGVSGVDFIYYAPAMMVRYLLLASAVLYLLLFTTGFPGIPDRKKPRNAKYPYEQHANPDARHCWISMLSRQHCRWNWRQANPRRPGASSQ